MNAPSDRLVGIYEELKFWLPLLAAGGFIYRGLNWLTGLRDTVQTIRTNDLAHLHGSVNDLQSVISGQTKEIVAELREMRADIRSLR